MLILGKVSDQMMKAEKLIKQLQKCTPQLEILLKKHFAPNPKITTILNWNAWKGGAKTVEFPACFCYQRRKLLATTKWNGSGTNVSTGKLTTDGRDMKKIAPVEKCTGPKELLDYFIQLFGQFPYHSILTKWQRDQLYSLFENLPLDQAICISDYSRGFACRF